MTPVYVTPIDSFAMSIFMYEGGDIAKASVRCIRNNNPGNLRPLKTTQKSDGGYRVFDSFADGWQHLIDDIQFKVDKHPELITVFDLINKYAPAGDSNNPTKYAMFVCNWLSDALGYQVTMLTRLSYLFNVENIK